MNDNKKDGLKLVTKEGKRYDVPPEGSLGLLALGYRGVMAWRERRREFLEAQKTTIKSTANF